jgi:hypothetical protein
MTARHPALSHDALTLLMDDHSRMKRLFDDFRKLHLAGGSGAEELARKNDLMERACVELTLHMYVVETIFYPEARKTLNDEILFNEAEVQHNALRDLIDQIDEGDAEDPMVCAMFLVLGQYADHHAQEEEREMFPLMRASAVDLSALGERMITRRDWLEREIGLISPESATAVPAALLTGERSWWDKLAAFARG